MKDRISKEEYCKLYGEYKDRLYRYALYRLGDPNDAEDAVSDTVLAAWQGIDKLKSSEAFGSWIFAILRNVCSKRIKELIADRDIGSRMGSEQLAGSGSAAAPPSLSTELSESLAMLGDDEREIVLLSVIGGFSSKEIARMTGLTAGSVRSKLSRSLEKMRDFLS